MSKETLFTIDIKELDNPFEREKLESLPNYILVELLIRHLKREIKAREFIYRNWITYDEATKFTTFNEEMEVCIKEIKELLEILGDKENE